MIELAERQRLVFILGPRASLDLESVARRAAAEGGRLVLVSVGPTISRAQRVVVDRALLLAVEMGLELEEVWATGPEDAVEVIEDGDVVTVLARGRQRRALGRVLSGPRPGHDRRGSPEAPRVRRVPALAASSNDAVSPWPEARASASDAGRVMPAGGAEEPAASESVEALAGREIPEPVLGTAWTKDEAESRKKAALRIYLGMAPGVGKTYAMLSEGQRRLARGTDVVVGVVQTYGRKKTSEMLEGLEVIALRRLGYRGRTFEEMDPAAVIERRPEVALVDELAHTNIPGSRRAKRWEDVLDLLAEGIVVITTLNVQHLASLNDVVAGITGIRQQETVPDWLLDLADQVELVDMSPYALQRRMRHGNVYPDPGKAELALRRFFTTENLTGLRELALMRVANQVDEALLRRWTGSAAPETRERILVCVSGTSSAEQLIRRGARIARRTGGDLVVMHVVTQEHRQDPMWIEPAAALTEELGGRFQVLEAEDAAEAVLSFAYRQHVTQIVVGESLRSRWQKLVSGSFVNRLIRKASNIDVHVLARRER